MQVYRVQRTVVSYGIRFADNFGLLSNLNVLERNNKSLLVCLLFKNDLNLIRRKADTYYCILYPVYCKLFNFPT